MPTPNTTKEEIANLKEWQELQAVLDAIWCGRPIHIPDRDLLERLATSLTAKHEADKEKAVEVGKIQALHIIEDLYSKAVDKADLIEMVNEAILAPTKTDEYADFERPYMMPEPLQAPTKTGKQGESISKSDLYGHSVTTPDNQTLN